MNTAFRAAGRGLWPSSGVGRSRHAFTLLEVLLAITIAGSLIIAAVSLALSMGEVWGNGSGKRLFDQHVRGVTRFLDTILRQAEPPPDNTATSGAAAAQNEEQEARQEQQTGPAALGTEGGKEPVVWQEVRGNAYGNERLLTFELPTSPGVFAWPEQPLPFVVCALRVDPREGLFLLWKSRLEIDFEDEEPRELLVSRYVTGIRYFYYDADENNPKWEEEDRPRTGTVNGRAGEWLVPQRIRLTFEYKGDKQETDLIIPTAKLGVPVY
jgi:prepilin-type N-terminal cleavage/methylation domain-containing protein